VWVTGLFFREQAQFEVNATLRLDCFYTDPSGEKVKMRIAAKTKTGLTVTADVIKKTYEKGKEVAKDFMKNMKIKFGDSVPKLNYTISPAEA
jgi:hypothetical protein